MDLADLQFSGLFHFDKHWHWDDRAHQLHHESQDGLWLGNSSSERSVWGYGWYYLSSELGRVGDGLRVLVDDSTELPDLM